MRATPNPDRFFTGSQIRTTGPSTMSPLAEDTNQVLLSMLTLHDNGTPVRPPFAEPNMTWAVTQSEGGKDTTQVFMYDGDKDQPIFRLKENEMGQRVLDLTINGKVYENGNFDDDPTPPEPEVTDSFEVGELRTFTKGMELPPNYEWAAGGVVNKADYPDLWAVIGNNYGPGDGTEGSFNLPNKTNLIESSNYSPILAQTIGNDIDLTNFGAGQLTLYYSNFFQDWCYAFTKDAYGQNNKLIIGSATKAWVRYLSSDNSKNIGLPANSTTKYYLYSVKEVPHSDPNVLILIVCTIGPDSKAMIWRVTINVTDRANLVLVKPVEEILQRYEDASRSIDMNPYMMDDGTLYCLCPESSSGGYLYKVPPTGTGANKEKIGGFVYGHFRAESYVFYHRATNTLLLFNGDGFHRASPTTGALAGYPKKLDPYPSSNTKWMVFYNERLNTVYFPSQKNVGDQYFVNLCEFNVDTETIVQYPVRDLIHSVYTDLNTSKILIWYLHMGMDIFDTETKQLDIVRTTSISSSLVSSTMENVRETSNYINASNGTYDIENGRFLSVHSALPYTYSNPGTVFQVNIPVNQTYFAIKVK